MEPERIAGDLEVVLEGFSWEVLEDVTWGDG